MPVKAASADSLQSKPSLAVRSLRAALAIASMGAFAYVFAYAYIEGTANGSSRVVPLLRADASPIKTRPTEPGGLRVPDRDKKIYERLRRRKKTKKTKLTGRLILRPGLLRPIREPRSIADRTISGGRARGIASIEPLRARKASKRISLSSQKLPATVGAYRVQIAAYPKPELAARQWRRLAVQPTDLGGKLKWYVEKVERGHAKGPLYRLQLGPLKSRKLARDLCAELDRRNITCFGVKG